MMCRVLRAVSDAHFSSTSVTTTLIILLLPLPLSKPLLEPRQVLPFPPSVNRCCCCYCYTEQYRYAPVRMSSHGGQALYPPGFCHDYPSC